MFNEANGVVNRDQTQFQLEDGKEEESPVIQTNRKIKTTRPKEQKGGGEEGGGELKRNIVLSLF